MWRSDGSGGPDVAPIRSRSTVPASRRLIAWGGIARGIAQNQALAVPAVRRWAASRHALPGEDAGRADAYQSYRTHTDVAGKAILELGPGKRLDVLRAARRDGARRCVAVDIVPYRDPEPGIEYRIYDGRSLPFGDAEFDVVWSWSVFEHLRWPAITLGEVARVLRPDGVMIARIDLRDHYALRPGPWREREEWLNCLRYPAWLWWLASSRRAAYVNRLRASEWMTLFRAAGLPPAHVGRQTSEVLRDAWRRQEWLRRWTEDDIAIFGLDVVARRA